MRPLAICAIAALLSVHTAFAQTSAPAKPDQHVIGTITAVDPTSHHITVKQDKTATAYTVSLENTKTLLKVEPGAKNLTGAARITANDLAPGDRVDVRGFKAESPTSIAAASLILMSARDLQKAHEAETQDWRTRGTAGTVTSIDPAAQKLNINVRTPQGPKPVAVDLSASTQFTRFSPQTPKAAVPSQLSDIQPGDQVRVLGNKSPDGSSITAEKIYSGSFRTVAGTITALSPAGNQMTVTDLRTKQPVQIVLTDDSAIRKLPPPVAMMIARHLNPGTRPSEASSVGSSPSPGSRPVAGYMPRTGDISEVIERLPKITASDLKPGDADRCLGSRKRGQIAARCHQRDRGRRAHLPIGAVRARAGNSEATGIWTWRFPPNNSRS